MARSGIGSGDLAVVFVGLYREVLRNKRNVVVGLFNLVRLGRSAVQRQ
jgi:hypothetical protein